MNSSREDSRETITVSGVQFSADQVKSAILEVDGREIRISEKKEEEKEKRIGFQ